jgi:hypothetical protein
MHPPWGFTIHLNDIDLNPSNLANARHGWKNLYHTTVATSSSFAQFLTFMKIYTSGYGFFIIKKLEQFQFWFHKKIKIKMEPWVWSGCGFSSSEKLI